MEKFKGKVSLIYVSAKDKWTGISRRTQIISLAVAAAVILTAIILTVVLNSSEMSLLVRASDRDEALQMEIALAEAEIDEFRVNRNHEVFIRENQRMAGLRALSEAGLPRPGGNNDIWRDGVDMFSTGAQITEVQRQQLQDWIVQYLNEIPQVERSQVILHVPETRNFVMINNREESRASVRVTLRMGEYLTNDQIEGIHLFVLNSVPGLDADHITVTDGNGMPLIPGTDDITDPGSELALLQQRMAMEASFKELIAENALRSLQPLLERVYGPGNYSLAVNAILDNSEDRTVESEEFIPVAGTDRGVIRNIVEKMAAGGTALIGGPVGTFGNSDIAPGYPTIPDLEAGEEFFLENLREMNYEISRRVETYRDNGLRIRNVSASVVVNREPMPPAQMAEWEAIVANATGANEVAFATEIFFIPPVPPPEVGRDGIFTRNVLIWIIVPLGILLIILLILAITTSNSKKKRLVRARGFIPAVDGPSGYLREDSFQPLQEEPEGFDLPSLLDENETKDVVLKREIREFTRSNPEIIAQLIRTWLRDEDTP
ncbi:MAG: hypothetical protein FWF76_06030 [Oscillospiraceae bacterium]|nr:hypothetical protein [Oscillospiraceae bacterium]